MDIMTENVESNYCNDNKGYKLYGYSYAESGNRPANQHN